MTDADDFEAFMFAVRDMVAACNRIGTKPPNTIGFKTGSPCNLISEQIIAMKSAGHPYATENVKVNAKGRVEIEGVVLTVAWL